MKKGPGRSSLAGKHSPLRVSGSSCFGCATTKLLCTQDWLNWLLWLLAGAWASSKVSCDNSAKSLRSSDGGQLRNNFSRIFAWLSLLNLRDRAVHAARCQGVSEFRKYAMTFWQGCCGFRPLRGKHYEVKASKSMHIKALC